MRRLAAKLRARQALLLAGMVAVIAVTAAFGAAAALADGQRDNAELQLARRNALVVAAASAEIGRYVDAVGALASATGAFENLTAAKFAQVTAPLASRSLAGATSVVFLVPADDGQVAATQAHWRTRGLPGLRLQPAAAVPEHLFTVFGRALDNSTDGRLLGIDVAQAPVPVHALREARRTGQVTISDAYQLLIDRNLPEAQRQMSFVLAAPVYATSAVTGARTHSGWILMGLRGQKFLDAALAQVSQGLLDVTLTAEDAAGRPVTVAAVRSTDTRRRDLTSDGSITVADHRWQLHVAAHGAALPGGITGLPAVVAVSGSLLGLLLAGLVWVLATGRARAEAKVRTATSDLREREADLRAFAAVAAHDLRAPLSVVAGYADLLDEGLAEGDDAATLRPTAARIISGVDRMCRLIDDLLAYATARDGSLNLEPVPLRRLVDEVVTDRIAHLPPPLPDITTASLPTVLVDRAMVRQLLDNLIGNALKYTHPGRPACIIISGHPQPDGRVRIDVADRGIGIPPDDRPRVFTSFHRVAQHADGYPGTGLGLAICHRVVERHGGDIAATDNPGGGTVISFTLPLMGAAPVATRRIRPAPLTTELH
ncbi:sensor histidine kinase [Paractinoplanes durhamensis]|uniref:Sensor-like histidine kinase SenX3 n=1 Tax=Paractinoplanes durhamensis TaxID=113563 RepID=A0ABQ3YRA6_9ACTN|nr:ATP-binding protein [Actinoplanes durhamensis]GIE00121.1 hypothetical protein Adu01nite_14710 [Actinoplanes durhamensis]